MKTTHRGTLADLQAAARVYLTTDLYDRTDWRERQFPARFGDYTPPHSTEAVYGDTRVRFLWEWRTDSGHWAPFPLHPIAVVRDAQPDLPVAAMAWVGLFDAVAMAESIRGVDDEAVDYDLCETPGLPETVVVKCDRYVDPDGRAVA